MFRKLGEKPKKRYILYTILLYVGFILYTFGGMLAVSYSLYHLGLGNISVFIGFAYLIASIYLTDKCFGWLTEDIWN